MSINIDYCEAEKLSFELVPETCPAVTRALDHAFKHPDLGSEEFAQIFAKYGVELDYKARNAMQELFGRLMFNRRAELESVVFYEGTFALRAALVDELQRSRNLPGENHFAYWVDDYKNRKGTGNG